MKKSSLARLLQAGTLGALIGGAAGFGLGVLVAPEAGKKTRRRLIYQLEQLAWRAADLSERIMQSQAESEARRTGDELVADAQEQAQRIRNDIDELLGEIRKSEEESSVSN